MPLSLRLEPWHGQDAVRARESKGGQRKGMIIAVDFDGILCKNSFPHIGEPNYNVISLIRQLIDKGHEVVLWTVRNGKELENAVAWCNDYGLHFCAVNDQAPSNKAEYAGKYETESRKVYADYYIDDHNLEYDGISDVEDILEGGLEKWQVN